MGEKWHSNNTPGRRLSTRLGLRRFRDRRSDCAWRRPGGSLSSDLKKQRLLRVSALAQMQSSLTLGKASTTRADLPEFPGVLRESPTNSLTIKHPNDLNKHRPSFLKKRSVCEGGSSSEAKPRTALPPSAPRREEGLVLRRCSFTTEASKSRSERRRLDGEEPQPSGKSRAQRPSGGAVRSAKLFGLAGPCRRAVQGRNTSEVELETSACLKAKCLARGRPRFDARRPPSGKTAFLKKSFSFAFGLNGFCVEKLGSVEKGKLDQSSSFLCMRRKDSRQANLRGRGAAVLFVHKSSQPKGSCRQFSPFIGEDEGINFRRLLVAPRGSDAPTRSELSAARCSSHAVSSPRRERRLSL